MAGKFELKKNAAGQYSFNLKAGNGEIILRSETYSSKAAAINGIESVQTNAPQDDRYDKLIAKNGQFYFNLLAANHQVIGTSETYTTESGRDRGIASVKTNAPGAEIVESSGA